MARCRWIVESRSFWGYKDQAVDIGVDRRISGLCMNLTLREEDRRAVDLILDRSPKAAGTGSGQTVYATADPSLGQRVSQAQRLLQLLEWLPQGEPPADLVGRTVQFVEQSAHRGPIDNSLSSVAADQRPMA